MFLMGEKKNRGQSITLLGVLIIAIQLFDIAVHILTNQVELIRIASNVLIMFWVSAPRFLSFSFSRKTSFAVLFVYLLLNLIFLFNNGLWNNGSPRIVFFMLITFTSLLSVLLIKKKATAK